VVRYLAVEKLSKKEQEYLKGYAQALQDIMWRMTGENTCAKSYDPVGFSDDKIHSYAFDMKDGGRHHPLIDYKDIEDIKECMAQEAEEWLRNG